MLSGGPTLELVLNISLEFQVTKTQENTLGLLIGVWKVLLERFSPAVFWFCLAAAAATAAAASGDKVSLNNLPHKR